MKPLEKSIYLISDGKNLRREGKLVAALEAALIGAAGAIRYVQLREQVGENPASDEELFVLGCRVRSLCDKYGASMFISKNIRLAGDVGADGVHIGPGGDLAEKIESAREADLLIGYSAHSVDEIAGLASEKLDYFFLSPIFKPKSKEDSRNLLGLETVSQAAELLQPTDKKLFALGGIGVANASDCLLAGADGVAVIGSVLSQPDVQAAAGQLAKSLQIYT